MTGSAGPGAEAGVGTIETRSIDYVPESERHGKIWQQGPFWFLGTFQFFTITIGFIGPWIVFRRGTDGRWLGVHEHLSAEP